MMRIGILMLGLAMGANAFASDNDIAYGGGFFNYNGAGTRFDRIWIGKYQVQKYAACNDGTNVYAYVTDCARLASYGNGTESGPTCEVGGYQQFLISTPIQQSRWVCFEETGTSNENRGCATWGQAPYSLDVSGVPACSSQQRQQQQQQQQQQRQQFQQRKR